jgi:hypothetical protein
MKSRWFSILATVIGLALFCGFSVPVAAATPGVDLVLGGSGATPWTIGNIAPGSSGTETVTLKNIGSTTGVVTIWVSNNVNSEGSNLEPETGNTAEPGELGNYLTLKVSGANLATNFTMPAIINNLPQSAADARHIYVSPLNAGATVTLQWDWRLPPLTGNDAQGDILSFTINYSLEESLPTPPGGGGSGGGGTGGSLPPGSLPQLDLGATILVIYCSDSVMVDSEFDYIIQVTNENDTGDLHNLTIVGSIPGEMSLISADGPTLFTYTGQDILFEPLVSLPPGETVDFYIKVKAIAAGTAVFNVTLRWDEFGEAVITTSSVEVLNLEPFTSTSPSPPASIQPVNLLEVVPACFEVRGLTVDPAEAICGESISINCDVVNTGGQSGEYRLLINIPGLLQTSRLIKLEAGQAQTVSFALLASNPGTYRVEIGGVNDTFIIGILPPARTTQPVLSNTQIFTQDWLIPLIIMAIVVAGSTYHAIVVLMRRRQYRQIRQGRWL